MSASKAVWEQLAVNYKTAFESLEEIAKYLERTETRHIFSKIDVKHHYSILDLGCGTGRWTFEFAKRCKRVVAVDFADGMIKRAREEAENRGFTNIEFVKASVEQYQPAEKFDIIIISGVLVYLTDALVNKVVQNVSHMLAEEGILISRETVAIKELMAVDVDMHKKTRTAYSATYRLPHYYFDVFAAVGLKNHYAEDFTPINFATTFYRKFIPKSLHEVFVFRKLLQAGLHIQYWLDPFLLKHKWLYRPLLHKFWKIKSMLFFYGLD